MKNYTSYKITPDQRLTNKNNLILADAVQSSYKMPFQLIKNWRMEETSRVYFDIELTKTDASFYFIVPSEFDKFFPSKLQATWEKSNTTEMCSQLKFNLPRVNASRLVLKDFAVKSLSHDLNELTHLSEIFEARRLLVGDDKVRISICFEPIKHAEWLYFAKTEMRKYKQGEIIDNSEVGIAKFLKQLSKILERGLDEVINTLIEFIEIIVLSEKEIKEKRKSKPSEDSPFLPSNEKESSKQKDGLSNSTTYKQTAPACRTSIILLTESESQDRNDILQLTLQSAFKSLTLDNELVPIKIGKKYHEALIHHRFNGSKQCILSNKEVAKLMQLPQSTLQRRHRIHAIETKEEGVHDSLLTGSIRVGEVSLPSQNKKVMTHFDNNNKNNSFTVGIMGPEGCGKTYQACRIAKESYEAGNSNFVLDFISDNKFSKEVMAEIPEKDRMIIEIKNGEDLPCFAYPEISNTLTEESSAWERKHVASLITGEVINLVNSLTEEGTGNLTSAMRDLVGAASRVVFIHRDAKLNDVVEVLEKPEIRERFINRAIPVYGSEHHIITKLIELDKYDNEGNVVGTNSGRTIEGIKNRFSILRENLYTEEMLYVPPKMDENLGEWVKEGKSIFIMIPQRLIPSKSIRDALVTFYISRLWLMAQVRGDDPSNRLCNVFVDEIHNLPTAAKFIAKSIQEFRRHKIGLVITCHYLGQFKDLEEDILAKRTNFIICRGFNIADLGKIEERIKPFDAEDIAKLKQYEALCVIENSAGRHTFIAKLAQKRNTSTSDSSNAPLIPNESAPSPVNPVAPSCLAPPSSMTKPIKNEFMTQSSQLCEVKKINSRKEYDELLAKIKNNQTKRKTNRNK